MKSYILAAMLALLALSGYADPAPSESAKVGYEGRLLVEGAAVSGAKVYAYKTFQDFLDSKPESASALTGSDGKYTLDIPQGKFYLVAKKRKNMEQDGPVEMGELFSFHGSNPVAAAKGRYVHVGFCMLPYAKGVSFEPYQDQASGGLSGVVTYEGKPLQGAYVTLYMDTAEDLRGGTYAGSPPTGATGAFRFDNLPETDYYVVARKRSTGKAAGPLADGDQFGFHPANPIHVKAGKMAVIELPVVAKAGDMARDDTLFRDTGTRVTGRILDKWGKPVPGVYVFAYLEKVMGHKRPEYISKAVDKEGGYTLNLPSGGTFYLGARSNYGDTPALGEWYGRWEGTGDHSVEVKAGEILKNIDITVEKILQ